MGRTRKRFDTPLERWEYIRDFGGTELMRHAAPTPIRHIGPPTSTCTILHPDRMSGILSGNLSAPLLHRDELEGFDLRNLVISYVGPGSSLAGADLRGAHVMTAVDVNFEFADLRGAYIESVVDCNFRGARFTFEFLRASRIDNCHFDEDGLPYLTGRPDFGRELQTLKVSGPLFTGGSAERLGKEKS